MQQYFEIKSRYPNALLFYRMGDFYELFFEDAHTASSILDIALTKRGKHEGEEIPMCGVPVHAAEIYLPRLIASGHNVAICEQLETPEEAKKRGYKAIVKRDVVRLVTPGTITEEALLAPNETHYLAALHSKGSDVALSWLDISTGEWRVMTADYTHLHAQLARLQPREILITEAANTESLMEWKPLLRTQHASTFDALKAERNMKQHFGVHDVAGIGHFTTEMLGAMGALLHYVSLSQMQALPRLDIPAIEMPDAHLFMDASTRRNLELTHTLTGERKGALLQVIDKTLSAAGGRLFYRFLTAPSRDIALISARLDAVEWLKNTHPLREKLRHTLRETTDIERAIGRIALGRGGPRDLLSIRQGLANCLALREALFAHHSVLPPMLRHSVQSLHGQSSVLDTLQRALANEAPVFARDGGFIAAGYKADLDEWRRLRDEGKRILLALEQRLKNETGIPSLKIKHNNVLGYFIEITQIHEKKVPDQFIHRQSLAGVLRYSTPELNETARNISEAADKALRRELEYFEELCSEMLAHEAELIDKARASALLDFLAALAHLAEEGAYTRPNLSESSLTVISQGRHPVIERALQASHQEFIANDCTLTPEHGLHWLITGPNMGGKSTFLRQNAIIVLMAHMGSFVPAAEATIGITDKLFCRVGAADDLARGRSTFMVEMLETAAIINQATAQSFVVLDEIGRGTATYDGMAIAWAVMEHLATQTQCRTLFATHYHELTVMAETIASVRNYHASVKEYQGQLVFMHQIKQGVANRSYGVQVAALAGLPKHIITRAKQLLNQFESSHEGGAIHHDLPLLAPLDEQNNAVLPKNPALEKLSTIQPDALSAKQALDLLYELKALAED